MKKLFTFIILSITLSAFAQPKAGYYNAAVGKTEAALKTQLYSIISTGTTNVGYDGLYNVYPTSDKTATGKVWDMYSTCTWTHGNKKCGNYSIVCDCYNREHSIPQSWFNEQSPMVSDAHHIYPTDGKVNGQRSNYPYGECSGGSSLGGGALGRLGNSTFAGYSGTVFEPIDEYKGDFARTYFYFATRYQNIMTSFVGGPSFDHTTYPSMAAWSINLYLKWSRQDPVSEKEITRNNAIDAFQHNRNPFIDHPELAEFIWGTRKGQAWTLTSGISETKIEFSISPNPVQNELTIKSDETELSYTIFNLNGQALKENQLTLNHTISVDDLQNGMYLLQLKSGTRKSIQKFIVSK
jgi:endonuclease I